MSGPDRAATTAGATHRPVAATADPLSSYPLSWVAVHAACAEVDRGDPGAAPAADAVELWVHDAREAVAQRIPATGRVISAAGGAFGASCRVWRGDRFGTASRTVDGPAGIRALIAEADRAAEPGAAPARPDPGRPAAAAGEQNADPPCLDTAAAEDLTQAAATRLAALGAQVQVVLAQQYQWITGTARRDGPRTAQYHEQTRLLVRCETPHGAVVDAAERQVIAADPGLDGLAARVGDALDALAGPGGPAPEGLPVLLRPAVAAPLVAGLSWLLSGRTALDTPGLARAVGKRLFPSCLQVDDVPGAHPDGAPLRHDDEGLPAGPVELVDHGRLVGFLHSTDTAARLGHRPNGRGIRMGVGAAPMPRPVALRVAAGLGAIPPDHIELTCRLDNLNTMPRTGQIEMIVAGWEVRGGCRTRRIGPFEFGCDLLRYWRTLRGTGPDPQVLPLADGAAVPSLCFGGLP